LGRLRRNIALLALVCVGVAWLGRAPRGWTRTYLAADGTELLVEERVPPPNGSEQRPEPAQDAARVRYTGLLQVSRPGTWIFGVREARAATLTLDGQAPRGNMPTAPGADYRPLGFVELERGLADLELELELGTRAPALSWAADSTELAPATQLALPRGTSALRLGLEGGARILAGALLFALVITFLPRGARRRLTAAALGLAMMFFVAELSLRFFGIDARPRVPASIWMEYDEFKPGTTVTYRGQAIGSLLEFATEVRINAKGWRERAYEPQKSPGTRRLVLLGDSYVEGKEVAFEDTFHERLEAQLNTGEERWEVIAFGRGGSGTREQLRVLRSEALIYSPDVVLVAVFPGNDVSDNSPVLNGDLQRWKSEVLHNTLWPARTAFLERADLWEPSNLSRVLADRLCEPVVTNLHWFRADLEAGWLRSPQEGLYDEPLSPRWEDAWRATERALEKIVELSRSNGAEPVVLAVPSRITHGGARGALPAAVEARPYQRLAAISAELEVDLIDPSPAFRAAEEAGAPTSFPVDGHWNERGHELAAEAVLAWMRAEGP